MKYDRIIMLIDTNSAYLSWEAAYRVNVLGHTLDLRNVPSAVAGNPESRRGIILAKSNPAKALGVKTGEANWEAKQKAPGIILVSPNYLLYLKCSNAMNTIFAEYTDLIQRYSIDESFLDVTNSLHLFGGDPIKLADEIRERVKNEVGVTVNVGISTNKLLAKQASEFNKTDKTNTLYPHELKSKLWKLPLDELFGCGRAYTKKFEKLGLLTIGDLANSDKNLIKAHYGKYGCMLHDYANGREYSPVRKTNRPIIKGIGNSTTTHFDITDREEAYKVILSLTETVGMRLRDAGYCARLVSVHMKNTEFVSYSHQEKFFLQTDATNEIYKRAKKLFNECWKGEPLRHLGVRVSDLCSNDLIQMSLFDVEDTDKQQKMDRAIDKIRFKYGSKSVIRSCFLYSGIGPIQGGIDDGYPMVSSIIQ